MKIECAHDKVVDLDTLVPNPRNANEHPDAQIKLLAKIMKHQGWRNPIVVSNRSGFMTKGHGRLLAAKLNGWVTAPVDYQDYRNEADEWADMIADNKIAELAESNEMRIQEIALDLGKDFDFDLFGIPDFKVVGIDTLPPGCDEDAVPSVPAEATTKLGDIYKLGRHRLMCGDSTSIDSVEKLMDGVKAEICFTSPPYNAGRKPMQSERSNGGIQHDKYNEYDDEKGGDDWARLVSDSLVAAMIASHYQLYNVQHLAGNKVALIEWLHQFKNHLVDTAIWNKGYAVPQMAENVMGSQFEYVYIFSSAEDPSKAVTTAQFKRGFSNVYDGQRQSQNEFSKVHAATFPVHLPEHFLSNFSNPKGSVLDLFGGTGTTMIAAENCGRNCFMMELDPKYCDVIVARWEKYTGKEAELING